MKLSHLIFFLTIISTIYFLMHYYVYSRIAYGLLLSNNSKNYLKILMWVGGASFFVCEILSRKAIVPYMKPMVYSGFVWLGVISISVAVFLAADIFSIFFKSQSFRYYSILSSLTVIALFSAYSLYNVTWILQTKNITIPIIKLPQELSGFTIVQLSDIHLDSKISDRWLGSIIERTNSINPDLIVITGDLIDADLCKLNRFCVNLRNLKSKYGVFAITGNHEYYSGIDKFIEVARNSNIEILRNTSTTIAGRIELAGIDDKEFVSPSTAMESAFKNIDYNKPIIFLSHQPFVFDEALKYKIDLQLSGHLHAGQIPPLDIIVKLLYKYPYGLYKKGLSYIYTTSGTGTWGPPMRLFSKSEIVKIVLVANRN